MPEIRKLLTKIHLTGAAGVDHPAHQHEGWMVMKNDAAAAIREVVRNAMRSTSDELDQRRNELGAAIAENQRALDGLVEMMNGRITKSDGTLRTEVESLIAKTDSLVKWLGSDTPQTDQPEKLTSLEASRIFWGLD